jgi:hypothetical protein
MASPEMRRVLSTHVLDIGYAEDGANGELHVRFAPTAQEPTGPLVIYQGVPPAVAAAVMASPSIGQALHQHIRGQYEHTYPERL